MNYTELLKNIWDLVYNPEEDTAKVIETYFHKNYKQCINGISMNRTEYIHHVIEQKRNMLIDTIEYQYILEKGNELFALYYPKGRNKEHFPVEVEVIAYFCFEHQQLIKIHGQVRLIQGNLSDVDMTRSQLG